MASNWVTRIKASQPVMYSVAGAKFQEYCLAHLDNKGSEAHRAIGRLVNGINAGYVKVDVAQAIYNGLLSKGR